MKSRNKIFAILPAVLLLGLGGCASNGDAGDMTAAAGEQEKSEFGPKQDQQLAYEVRRLIRMETDLVDDDLQVSVSQRVVTVTGSISNRLEARRLEEKIKELDGVRGVIIEVYNKRTN